MCTFISCFVEYLLNNYTMSRWAQLIFLTWITFSGYMIAILIKLRMCKTNQSQSSQLMFFGSLCIIFLISGVLEKVSNFSHLKNKMNRYFIIGKPSEVRSQESGPCWLACKHYAVHCLVQHQNSWHSRFRAHYTVQAKLKRSLRLSLCYSTLTALQMLERTYRQYGRETDLN